MRSWAAAVVVMAMCQQSWAADPVVLGKFDVAAATLAVGFQNFYFASIRGDADCSPDRIETWFMQGFSKPTRFENIQVDGQILEIVPFPDRPMLALAVSKPSCDGAEPGDFIVIVSRKTGRLQIADSMPIGITWSTHRLRVAGPGVIVEPRAEPEFYPGSMPDASVVLEYPVDADGKIGDDSAGPDMAVAGPPPAVPGSSGFDVALDNGHVVVTRTLGNELIMDMEAPRAHAATVAVVPRGLILALVEDEAVRLMVINPRAEQNLIGQSAADWLKMAQANLAALHAATSFSERQIAAGQVEKAYRNLLSTGGGHRAELEPFLARHPGNDTETDICRYVAWYADHGQMDMISVKLPYSEARWFPEARRMFVYLVSGAGRHPLGNIAAFQADAYGAYRPAGGYPGTYEMVDDVPAAAVPFRDDVYIVKSPVDRYAASAVTRGEPVASVEAASGTRCNGMVAEPVLDAPTGEGELCRQLFTFNPNASVEARYDQEGESAWTKPGGMVVSSEIKALAQLNDRGSDWWLDGPTVAADDKRSFPIPGSDRVVTLVRVTMGDGFTRTDQEESRWVLAVKTVSADKPESVADDRTSTALLLRQILDGPGMDATAVVADGSILVSAHSRHAITDSAGIAHRARWWLSRVTSDGLEDVCTVTYHARNFGFGQ